MPGFFSSLLGRIGTTEDIAYGVLYLASDEASFVTGSELVIDGGYSSRVYGLIVHWYNTMVIRPLAYNRLKVCKLLFYQ